MRKLSGEGQSAIRVRKEGAQSAGECGARLWLRDSGMRLVSSESGLCVSLSHESAGGFFVLRVRDTSAPGVLDRALSYIVVGHEQEAQN